MMRFLVYIGLFMMSTTVQAESARRYEIVIVGGTPAGIMAAISAARCGHNSVILERTAHIGGLPANGLGATDIATRGATGGLFQEFVDRVRRHYVKAYGEGSPQVKACSDGYHFEPHVAEQVFAEMLSEQGERITVLLQRQFDADPENVTTHDGRLRQILMTDRTSGKQERYDGEVFIDATYEGDLAAAAGAPYMLGREGREDYGEALAGRLYMVWKGFPAAGSTGMGDNAVQAYNYRLCLTNDPTRRVPIAKPKRYNRAEYISLIDDVLQNRTTGTLKGEMAFDGIGRITNMASLPNNKTDANNQHQAFISTDLPEENWPWPTSDWAWRDRFAQRLRDYTLGLFYFAQHDPGLPEDFRRRCLEWGLASDEYADNANFPRQPYVREGRRIRGEYLFTANDALPVSLGARPPVHRDSITASHYDLDSHAVRKREPGRAHLDGFFGSPAKPYTVPYGVIVPRKVDGLLVPVAASATHIGFSTLRMEPCWTALGQAAGVASSLAIERSQRLRQLDVSQIQERLLAQQATLIYFRGATPAHPHYRALQFFTLRGLASLDGWEARLDDPVSSEDASQWITRCAPSAPPAHKPGQTTRGQLLQALYDARARF